MMPSPFAVLTVIGLGTFLVLRPFLLLFWALCYVVIKWKGWL